MVWTLLFRDVTGKSISKEKGHEERNDQQAPQGLPIRNEREARLSA